MKHVDTSGIAQHAGSATGLDLGTVLPRGRRVLGRIGVLSAAHMYARSLTSKAVLLAFHRSLPPTMTKMLEAAASTHTSAVPMLRQLLSGRGLRVDIDAAEAGFEEVWAEMTARAADLEARGSPWERFWAVEKETARLLYTLVRSVRPGVVFETGVAAGMSTAIVLKAMDSVNVGQLHSTDLSAGVGQLVIPADRQRWHLHVLDQRRPRSSFRSAVASAGQVDLFIHDSMHTYTWTRFECQTVLRSMSPGSLLACDDAETSCGYLDVCHELRRSPCLLIDTRKVFAVVAV